MITAWVVGWCVLGALGNGGEPGKASPALSAGEREAFREAESRAGRDAEAHRKLALWCEAHGLDAERLKHLALAVAADPKNAAARGLLGMVAFGGRWKDPADVPEAVKADADLSAALAEYNARRDQTPDTAEAHWTLALWCEQKGLVPEAKAHLNRVVQLDPTREAAWKRLGCRKVGGRWLSAEQADAERAETEAQAQANRRWVPQLATWRLWLGQGRSRRLLAVSHLGKVRDPRAVAAVWRVFVQAGDPIDQARAVTLLRQIDAPAATRALALLATLSVSPGVRREAAGALGARDSREVIRLLIDLLHDPLQYEVVEPDGPGAPGILFVEGETYNVERYYAPPPSLLTGSPDRAAARRELAGDVQALDAENSRLAATKARVVALLTETTGQNLGNNRDAWLAWWAGEHGYAHDSTSYRTKPTYTQYVPVAPTPVVIVSVHTACFARGTLVRTMGGDRVIETLKVGDRVLSQDVATGVLSYQPVTAALHNKPAPTYVLKLGGETVVATGIHRFWKARVGWTMARDLKPGDAIRTVGGTATVESVEPGEVQPVYNLEVASNRNFFVGSRGALVHDYSPVQPVEHPFDAEPSLHDAPAR